MLTYQEVVTTKLEPLTTAAAKWEAMAEAFKKIEDHYAHKVRTVAEDGRWVGLAAIAASARFKDTQEQLSAAQKQAKAIASLLRQAHTQFTALVKVVKDLVVDARKKHFLIDSQGKAAYDWSRLDAYARKDPDFEGFCRRTREAETAWTQAIKKAVRQVDEVDKDVERALRLASGTDSTGTFSLAGRGFNAQAVGDLKVYQKHWAEEGKKEREWKPEGEVSVKGLDTGFTVSGVKYGKEGSVKLYADLIHATAKGSSTDGVWKLTGIADGYVGGRATANWGFTDSGVTAKGEVSVGARGLAEGRVERGPLGLYGRAEGFAGEELSGSFGAGPKGVNAGVKAFEGAKVSAAGGAEVGGIGIGGTVEASAGSGFEVKWTSEKGADGKYHIGPKVNLTPGLGGGVGLEFTVDPKKVTHAAGKAADFVVDAAGDVKDGAVALKDGIVGLVR
ncbi:PPE domain-containing protein [Streptomyces sp. URMC 126]|uniref:PPE domain-containing protein n=1 Tax=Streptomyces sp. URMC 126 TaxID=3423401 RepID=UPI003F19B998